MNLNITFDGLEHSVALVNHAQEKFNHVWEVFGHFKEPLSARLVINHVKHDYTVELNLSAAGFHENFKRSGRDVYAVLNEVMDIAFQEADKHKERIIDERKNHNPRPN